MVSACSGLLIHHYASSPWNSLQWEFVSVTPHWSSFETYACESSLCFPVYSDQVSLFVFSSWGGTKGKSIGLLWSGAKAVIKRYRRQSHTRHQQWKSFACTALIFTPSVTQCMCLPLTSPLCFCLCMDPLPPPCSKLTQACISFQSCQCMQTHNILLMPWMPVIKLWSGGHMGLRWVAVTSV